ncbi:MAG: hypothetical protein AMXMBFR25_01560 [Lysobacterales bacterium]
MRWVVHVALCSLVLVSLPLAAANFCVSNTAELQAAIEAAASNADNNDNIRLRPGIYPSPANGFGREVFAPDDNIAISGGWRPLIGPCDLPGYDATTSVIDGEGQRAGLVIHRSGSGSGETNLSWLTIRGGRQMMSTQFYGNGGGLAIFGSGPAAIEHVIFQNNQANLKGGAVYVKGAQRVLRNNLFIDNQASSGSAVFAPGPGGAVLFSNNTVTRNPYPVPSGGFAFVVDFDISASSFVWNNIFHDNSDHPWACDLSGDGHLLVDNIVEHPCGIYAAGSSNNVNVDPKFVHPVNNPRLRPDSPAIDAGGNGGVSSRDLDGRPRQIGPAVDQGAYEADFMFANGFE